jgi:hypothetical protein
MLLKRNKAQAATELAIFGSLIIMAFSYLMLYSEKLNRQQAYIMQTFRAALAEAGGNGSASYTKLAHRRMANLQSPYNLGNLETFSSSASVLWGTGDSESETTEVDGISGTAPSDDGVTTETTTSSASASSNLTKTQSPGGRVATTRSMQATDTVTESGYGVTSSLDDGGKYSSGGGGISRSHTWNTSE